MNVCVLAVKDESWLYEPMHCTSHWKHWTWTSSPWSMHLSYHWFTRSFFPSVQKGTSEFSVKIALCFGQVRSGENESIIQSYPFIRFAKHTHAHTYKQDLIISYFSKRRGLLVSEQYTETVTTQQVTLHNV